MSAAAAILLVVAEAGAVAGATGLIAMGVAILVLRSRR